MSNFRRYAIWVLLAIWTVTGTAFIVVPIVLQAGVGGSFSDASLTKWLSQPSEAIGYSIIVGALFTKILHDAEGRIEPVNLVTGLVIASVSGLLVVSQNHHILVKVIQAVLLASPLMMCIGRRSPDQAAKSTTVC